MVGASVNLPDQLQSSLMPLKTVHLTHANSHNPQPPTTSNNIHRASHRARPPMPDFTLSVRCDATAWGDRLAVVGSWNAWDKNRFIELSTTPKQYPRWTATIPLPDHSAHNLVEFKYVIVRDGRIIKWETDGSGRNRVVDPAHPHVQHTFGQLPLRHPSSHVPHSSPSQHHHAPLFLPVHGESLDQLETRIVQITQEQRSWRQRLAFVRLLFTHSAAADEAAFQIRSLDHLVTISAYLTFLASGQVHCEEDGGHHRPNHHANEARQIEHALASVTQSAVDANQLNVSSLYQSYIPYVVRKIYPQLPSYSSQFTASVPLTRIRDIAHRGDIPHDFKQEIKHTLQNKLHRCAGPEDLKTSERLLERINNGDFSHGLKEQFNIFHQELRAFFNASSLDDRLRYLAHNQNTKPVAELASSLLGLKNRWRPEIEQLGALTNLRDGISNLDLMQSSSSTETSELPGEDVQKTRLADVDLENYAFVLLAGVAKNAENGTHHDFQWSYALKGLAAAMKNMSQSGIRPTEAHATAAELSALADAISSGTVAMHLLRAKAAVDRVLRFVHGFSAAISDVYSRRVASIGKALGVDQHAISVFAEAEIRSNVAFQASRIADVCAKTCRKALSLPPWDPLYVGEAVGRVVYAETLSELAIDDKDSVIAVCAHAEGDEDIPTNVRAVVLGRPIPHLSHLGVRARQAGVVLVAAEERAAFDAIWKRRHESKVRLVVTATEGLACLEECVEEKVSVEAEKSGADTNRSQRRSVNTNFDSNANAPLPLEKVTQLNGSSKSAFAGKLTILSAQNEGLFQAANGVALPHGIFQDQVSKHSKEYRKRVQAFSEAYQGNQSADEVANALRDFILTNFSVSDKTCGQVLSHFAEGARVMVRSSANAEDLEDMSGAGLYDSIANVDVDDDEELRKAITEVWASLWTKRAASNRAAYGVSHEQVSMAVLVQEMVPAGASFVAFSRDPVTKGDAAYVEMAIGMGETLASAVADGSPYRFGVVDGDITELAFASYSEALVPGSERLRARVVDYSQEELTINAEFRSKIVSRIAQTLEVLEKEFKGPQDIEGAITVDDGEAKVWVVQARPQIL